MAMAETALSLTRSILGSAITKVATAAAEEISQMMGVQNEIRFMKDELKTMQAFLLTAEAIKQKKPLLKVWAEQVRSLSYDIEDCLDEFMVHVGNQGIFHQLMNLKERHRIATHIRNLKSRVEEVSSRNTRYNLIQTEGTYVDDGSSTMEDVRNYSSGHIDEAQLVGFDTPKRELLEMINIQDNNDGPHHVICVVGMGGLGKTTLVRKIYHSNEGIIKNFPCSAWITVSQSLSKMEILKDLITKLLGRESLKTCLEDLDGKGMMQVERLASHLREGLKEKRYFVVLDDLWDIDHWNWIRNMSLPTNNNRASLVIVTTRNIDLAKICTTESLIYHLEPLKEEHAIELLQRKIGKNKEDIKNEKKVLLVKKCGYLPLAIITIGALFATKQESEWDELYEQLPSELEKNLSLEAIRRMVILSYRHLPSHIKPCFLYLSIFPEDFEIERKRLVNRWIAEGLVRGRVRMTLEDIGGSYFNELVNRSMIQPSRVNFQGIVKRCRVHDIMRDIIVSLSRDEGFVYICDNDKYSLTEDDNYRHIAYHVSRCSTSKMDWGRVRSLTIFGHERPIEHSPSLWSPQLRMIRALDLENADFGLTQKDMNNIGLLCDLKYVNIGYSNIYALPSFIGKLQGLQALEISMSCLATLPTGICKLKSLRILRCENNGFYRFCNPDKPLEFVSNFLCRPTLLTQSKVRHNILRDLHWCNTYGVKVPRGIGHLEELQILGLVGIKRTCSKAIGELGELSKLRKVTVSTTGATAKKCVALCKAIQKLSCLRSLYINAAFFSMNADRNGTLEWLNSISSPPPLLRTLSLVGRIDFKVDWFTKLTQLVKLHLSQSSLEEGKVIEILWALPNLMFLGLRTKSYAGKELVFGQGMILNLRKLIISSLYELREIRFERGALPQMESLQIEYCFELELGINGIMHLPNLKEISLGSGTRVARLCMLQDEVSAHPNHPVLRLDEDRSYQDLGNPEGSDEYFDARQSFADHAGEGSEEITAAKNNSQANPVSN